MNIEPDYFANLSRFKKLIMLLLISSVLAVGLSLLLGSFQMGLSLFLDSGQFYSVYEKSPFVGLVGAVLGIIFSGAFISAITMIFIDSAERSRTIKTHKLIKDAFETHSLIKVRKLLKELGIEARTRYLNITEAEIRLEISHEEIVKAINMCGQARLRFFKATQEVIIEDFDANKSYGCFIETGSKITIIATQNYSDAGVGHFAFTLARMLNANYLSNEFYSVGAPLKRRQVRFSTNDYFLDFDQKSGHKALDDFRLDIKNISEITNLFIYLGTSSGDRGNDIHILYGGKRGDVGRSIDSPIHASPEKVFDFYLTLKTSCENDELRVVTHEEFGNTDNKHLSRAINVNFKKDVIVIHISTKILWTNDELVYYKTVKNIYDSIMLNLM